MDELNKISTLMDDYFNNYNLNSLIEANKIIATNKRTLPILDYHFYADYASPEDFSINCQKYILEIIEISKLKKLNAIKQDYKNAISASRKEQKLLEAIYPGISYKFSNGEYFIKKDGRYYHLLGRLFESSRKLRSLTSSKV